MAVDSIALSGQLSDLPPSLLTEELLCFRDRPEGETVAGLAITEGYINQIPPSLLTQVRQSREDTF